MFFVYSYICTHKIPIMRGYFTIIIALITTLAVTFVNPVLASQPEPRTHYSLNDGWRFYNTAKPNASVQYLDLPHVWSVGDVVLSTANYSRQLHVPHTLRGKRLFLRFGGVMNEANLFVNGSWVGEHCGAYTAFTFEITDKVRYGENNTIMLSVSNGSKFKIFPVSTEHNLPGGIYRDVELIVTNRNIISPTFYSSEGVFVEQHEVSEERVSGVVTVHLSAMDEGAHNITVRFVAPDGYEVCRYTAKAGKAEKSSGVEIPYTIECPDLWSPESPTLYRVEAMVGNADKPSDMVGFNVGFRSVGVSKNNRLTINGKEVDIHGVNLAHDRAVVGAVLSDDNLREDLDLVKDMGANALRSVVGPHRSLLYDMCDAEGVVAWVDMPFARNSAIFGDICYYPSESLRENGFEQLREVIYQNYNHPSVVMWGLFSLVSQHGDDVVKYVRELNDLAHWLDKSRPTVGCSNADGDINFITDLIVLRQDVGWYKGSFDDIRVWCRQLRENKKFKDLRYGVCYGEDGCLSHVVDVVQRAERGARMRPERAQTAMHESYSSLISESEQFWGVWLDNMFDYASMFRVEGMNYSGMVGYDHKTKKDAYYLYRALWNRSEPTLYIAERRWKSRCDAVQTVRVYSSLERPMLIVGQDSVELKEVSKSRWQADSVVLEGKTMLRVVDGTGLHRDSVEVTIDKMRVSR